MKIMTMGPRAHDRLHRDTRTLCDRLVKSTAASESLKANVERAVSGDGGAVQYRRGLI
jgi:hypothetical protein